MSFWNAVTQFLLKIGLIEFWLDMSWLGAIKGTPRLFDVSLATTSKARNEDIYLSHSPDGKPRGLRPKVKKVCIVQKGGEGSVKSRLLF